MAREARRAPFFGRLRFAQPAAILPVPAQPVGLPVTRPRVLRGGSWNNNRDNARCANRNRNNPDNRNDNIGFRVCCAPHIDPTLRAPRFHARPGSAGFRCRCLR
jgi:hypothetical protein